MDALDPSRLKSKSLMMKTDKPKDIKNQKPVSLFDIDTTEFLAKENVNDDVSSFTNEHAEETMAMLRD